MAEGQTSTIIRPLTTFPEFERCVELQREAFGSSEVDLQPPRLYLVQTMIGGLVLGAFDGERMIGFLNSMPGIRAGKPYWHSHMLAVATDHRNAGIGAKLKLEQRAAALQRGIGLIQWTFDPLQAKNAWLNLEKLGVIVRRYQVELYGPLTSIQTDRLIAEWWLNEPRPRISPGDDVRRLYIPADVQALMRQSPSSFKDLLFRVREQFLKNFGDGYFVAGFERTGEWSAYLLIPGASRVYPAD
ncbi:MAG TPA: GNAT family N-acetyltransferase [Terriglobia bacterium]|jgi:predicted GNAT superfamily acetyltransferase